MLRAKPNANPAPNGLMLDALIGAAKDDLLGRDCILKPALKVELRLDAIIGNKGMVGELINRRRASIRVHVALVSL